MAQKMNKMINNIYRCFEEIVWMAMWEEKRKITEESNCNLKYIIITIIIIMIDNSKVKIIIGII